VAIPPKEFKARAEAGFKSLSQKRRPSALQDLQKGAIKGLNYYNKNSSKEVKKVAKSPDYKPKYKSLSKKDKQEAKYISKTTPGQRQFNRVAGDVVSTIAAPLGALKVLPKATRVVKELATKFTQSKKVQKLNNKIPEQAQGIDNNFMSDKQIKKLRIEYDKEHKQKLYKEFQQRMKKHGFFKDE
jgi:hypothetical protein